MHTLYMGNNKVKVWEEVSKLANLPELKTLMLMGNPCYGDADRDDYFEDNGTQVISCVLQIETLDGMMVAIEQA